MRHDKDLTRGMLKGLLVNFLVLVFTGGTEYLKWLFVLPVLWLIFQGIYNLEGIDNE
jgi:hypothetical protein